VTRLSPERRAVYDKISVSSAERQITGAILSKILQGHSFLIRNPSERLCLHECSIGGIWPFCLTFTLSISKLIPQGHNLQLTFPGVNAMHHIMQTSGNGLTALLGIYVQNPLDAFPRNFPVHREVANLLRTCCGLVSDTAVLRKRNTSIKKCHKEAKINFTKAQEKIYGSAWHNSTKAHNTC